MRIASIEKCSGCNDSHYSQSEGWVCLAMEYKMLPAGFGNVADHEPPSWCPLPTTGNEHYAAILCRTLVSEWKRTGTREVPTDIQER